MASKGKIPDNPLKFIRGCVGERLVFWTYHVNMRLKERSISRQMIFETVENYELIEAYPDDKYLPSYLVFTRYSDTVIHILFAVDVSAGNVRVITAYRPDPDLWDQDLKQRIKK